MDGASLERELQKLVGQTVAERYRLDALIGMGGMGGVFRAHHLGLRRDVAVKVLHRALTNDPQVSPRFDREAHSASRLDHPNCLRVTDYGSTSDGMKYMVMQLFDGFELADMLTGPLPPERALELMLQIVKGLEHAHGQGVVHRDLKPENVFVTRDHEGSETLRIFDFGIAKIVEGDDPGEKMTRVGLVFGTPQYMSPEQATGMEDIDVRADIYSAGIIFYEMLAGKPPFDASDAVAIIRMQVSMDPPPLPQTVPPAMAQVVAKMLAKRRDERYASATEVRHALEGLDTGATVVPGARAESSGSLLEKLSDVSALGERIAENVPDMSVVGEKLTSDRKWFLSAVVAGGIVVLAGLTCVLWPGGEKPTSTAEGGVDDGFDEQPPSKGAARLDPADGVSEADLRQVDAHIQAGDLKSARALLTPLLARHANDAQLLWRDGRVLVQERKHGEALARYGEAIDRDQHLLDDPVFYEELIALMQRPELGPQALDIATAKMGPKGHEFLIELVNRDRKVITYNYRHRALDELGRSPESAAKVDQKLNVALDLRQAKQADTPCKAYRDTLTQVSTEQDPYYVDSLRKSKVPKPAEGASADELAACEGLEPERERVLAELQGQPGAKAASGSSRRRRGGTSKKRSTASSSSTTAPASDSGKAPTKRKDDCDKPFAIFSKKCRK